MLRPHTVTAAALLLALSIPAAAAPQRADYSGLDPFWVVAEKLAADGEPSDADWAALFATPGYRTLKARENADRFFDRLLPLALSPSRDAEARQTIAEQPGLEMFITHLRAAFARRNELQTYRTELEGRALLDEALVTAQAWLPPETAQRFGAPPISFVIYQPDARGYERIVMDLLLAYERQATFPGLLAHETHHVLRRGLQGDGGEHGDIPEADLLAALNNLQAEGVADMIDKPAMLAITDFGDNTTDRALAQLSARFRGELLRAQQRLAEVDEILAAYAADPGAAAELGTRLRETLVMGGHPVGYHMAGVVVVAGGGERMIANVADPFDFVRAYNDAATGSPDLHVFSAAALRALEMLEGQWNN